MKHVYKLGGNLKRDGVAFSIKCVNISEVQDYLDDGWVDSFNALRVDESGSDHERFLRDEIERITGKKPGGRCSIDTLEKMHADAKAVEDGNKG